MSVTVQTTGLVPVPNVRSASASLTTLATSQLSLVASGVPITTLLTVHRPRSVLVKTSAGQAIMGGSVSMVVTVNVQFVLWPQLSVAMQLTMLIPTPNVLPEGGLQLAKAPPHPLLLVTTYVTLLLEHWPGSVAATILSGQFMDSDSVGTIVTTKL